MDKDIIIYSCIFGDYDKIKEPSFVDPKTSYILFTDNPNLKSKVWDIKFVNLKELDLDIDLQRAARYIKTHPKSFLPPTHKINIWIDSSFLIKISNFNLLLSMILQKEDNFACYKHGKENNRRTCLYDEANFCIEKHLANSILIQNQINKYKKEGFPKNFGLFSTGFLIRRNNEKTNNLNNIWWEEIKNGSKRDQISFTYCIWKLNFKVKEIGIGESIYNNPFLKKYKHIREREVYD